MKHLATIVGTLLVLSQTSFAAEQVTVDNFNRVETDFYFKLRADAGCLGVLCHDRGPKPIDKQDIVRLNRDTPYSGGVFDLNSPVTIELPEAGARFRSLVVINEDHYIKLVSYKAGKITLTRDKIGTRYAAVAIRTFMDPNSPADLEAGRKLQDAIKVTQGDRGKLDLPDWDQTQRKGLHDALLGLMRFVPDSRRVFGDRGDVDEVRHLAGTAAGWGGNREQDALYISVNPKENDGQKAYTLTVKDVPVDGFWSITVYNSKGLYEAPEDAISVNNVTAQKDKDGQITIHFGGDPKASNYLHIMPGWNYTARLYRPRADILNGKWKFPEAQLTN
ncbi:DUF1214 domain-containing protein [Bradyrhizobium sp. JR3.5]